MTNTLEVCSDRQDIKRAFGQLRDALYAETDRLRKVIGWQGGSDEFDVRWRQNEGYWCLLHVNPTEDRFWCPFGLDDARSRRTLSITCEINPPKAGVNRRGAGMFLVDARKRFYIAHSGKVGGGRRGIGQSAFLSKFRGRDSIVSVSLPDGTEREAIVLGKLGDPSLPSQIGHFLREVARVKALLVRSPNGARSAGAPRLRGFRPEFSGTRQKYQPDSVEAVARHGLVVDALAQALKGRVFSNDRNRDLFIHSLSGEVTHLFEAKTDLSTSSLYQAVGQLLLNGAAEAAEPRRILVVPGAPSKPTSAALQRLGIRVLTYQWRDGRPLLGRVGEIIR